MSDDMTQTPSGEAQGSPSEVSKVDRVRDLIVGPEKKAIENQLMGMKELFSQMLVENKKDYDRQVGDMKGLFVTILEENRKAFRDQLDDLSEALPKMLERKVSENQREGMIFLANPEDETEDGQQEKKVDKYNRIDAVKQIVLGGNMEDLEKSIYDIHKALDQKHDHQQQALLDVANQLEKQLANTSNMLTEAVAQMMDKFESALTYKDDDKAGRKLLSAYMRELGQTYTGE